MTVDVADPRVLSELSVEKLDETDGAPLAGAKFQLFHDLNPAGPDAGDDQVGTCTTSLPTGTCAVSDLDFGRYYWKETAGAAGLRPSGRRVLRPGHDQRRQRRHHAAGPHVHRPAVAVAAGGGEAGRHQPGAVGRRGVHVVDRRGRRTGTSVRRRHRRPAAAPLARTASARSRTWTSAPTTGRRPRRRPVISCRLMCSPPRSRSTPPMPAPRCRCRSFDDPRILSELTVRKLDATDNAPLAGGIFELYHDADPIGPDAGDDLVDTCTTHPARRRVHGQRTWTSAPTSGRRPRHHRATTCPATPFSDPITINADNAGTTLPVRTFRDPRATSRLVVEKLDATNQAALAGADFTLWLDEAPATPDRSQRTPWSAPAPPASSVAATSPTWTSAPTTGRRPRRRPATTFRPGPFSDPVTIDATNAGTEPPTHHLRRPSPAVTVGGAQGRRHQRRRSGGCRFRALAGRGRQRRPAHHCRHRDR